MRGRTKELCAQQGRPSDPYRQLCSPPGGWAWGPSSGFLQVPGVALAHVRCTGHRSHGSSQRHRGHNHVTFQYAWASTVTQTAPPPLSCWPPQARPARLTSRGGTESDCWDMQPVMVMQLMFAHSISGHPRPMRHPHLTPHALHGQRGGSAGVEVLAKWSFSFRVLHFLFKNAMYWGLVCFSPLTGWRHALCPFI